MQLLLELAGAHTEGATPDPIPNSAVKPLRANGSDLARDRESRSAPAFFLSRQRELAAFVFLAAQENLGDHY